MENKTVQYKRSIGASVGAGVGALFNGNGRRYYVLEHKSTSKYHTAGESQKIIVDQAELGRDSHCQVRFDDTFVTVSRRHAAIVKEGERWKIVHLSNTNSTFVNGERVTTERYLENGDEIQLSTGGPRIGFIVPAGKQGLVSSIRMTERFEMFRKQALRPYKNTIVCLSVFLLLSVSALVCWNAYNMHINKEQDKKISKLNKDFEEAKKNPPSGPKVEALMAKADSLRKENDILKGLVYNPEKTVDALLDKVRPDVFFLFTTKVVVTDGQDELEIPNYAWFGTGFLTTDGYFVTAKHCVNGWLFPGGFPTDNDTIASLLSLGMTRPGLRIKVYFKAVSNKRTLHLTSDDFVMDHSTEYVLHLDANHDWKQEGSLSADWAYAKRDEKGSIRIDKELAQNLPMAAKLHVLGFPHGWGAIDTYKFNCHYGSCVVSQSGLDKGGIISVSDRNFESGNSGGPVFYIDNGILKAVGIVSYGRGEFGGGLCSISNLQ